MSNHETEQLVASIFRASKAEARKGRRRDPKFEAIREAHRKAQEEYFGRSSNIPPGWDGKHWGE